LYLDIQKLALPAVMSMVVQLGVAKKEAFIQTMRKAFEEIPGFNTTGDFHIICAVKPI
jgi:hypothetical protein